MEDFRREDLEILENRAIKKLETEPTPELEPRPRFNWIALIVMLVAVGVVLLVGVLIPGIFDEYIAIVVINLVYWFVQNHGGKIPQK